MSGPVCTLPCALPDGLRGGRQGGSDKLSEEEIEQQLDKVVKLLAYISDKDMFSEFYRKKLARRLLNDFSASDELERSILSRLKQQCGAQFTSKVAAASNAQAARRRRSAGVWEAAR